MNKQKLKKIIIELKNEALQEKEQYEKHFRESVIQFNPFYSLEKTSAKIYNLNVCLKVYDIVIDTLETQTVLDVLKLSDKNIYSYSDLLYKEKLRGELNNQNFYSFVLNGWISIREIILDRGFIIYYSPED